MRKRKRDENQKKKGSNSEILLMLYTFVGIFVVGILYFGIFIAKDSRSVINNSYNKRANLLAQTIFRGNILSSDGDILAHSVDRGDGTEKRVYPYGDMFVHVVGRFDHSKTGLEASEDFTLLTSSINPIETVYNQLTDTKSIGDNIITTLDVDLQKVAYNALGNRRGAIVVMEPSTGKILAMVSKPDYDPNQVNEEWDRLIADENKRSPLLNRATQGLYPPGSTFKMVTLLSYIRQNPNYKKYTYDCTGEAEFGDSTIHCYNHKVHGEQTLKEAFANSCNTAFSTLGTKLDLNVYRDLCNRILLNTELPVDFTYKKGSFVLNSSSDIMEVAQTMIGQGKTLVTPLFNAMFVSAIANDGNVMTPYLVDHIENYHGHIVSKNTPKMYKNIMTTKEAGVLSDYMKAVVEQGTATSLKNSSYTVAGKTGTAEVGSNERAHAWFAGFAPATNPKVAVSIIVENGGVASENAVPIAKKIFHAYFDKYSK